MKSFWNERYASHEYVYGREPNAFLKEQLDAMEPDRILFPLEGEGRNAVYAAKKGWTVDAFDFSKEGKRKALKLADDHNVKLHYDIHSAQEYTPQPAYYKVIALIFAHFPPDVRPVFHKSITKGLENNGILIMEAFHEKQINRNTGGPPNINLLYSREELLSDFEQLDIINLEETETELNEGPYHQGLAHVIRLIARKK